MIDFFDLKTAALCLLLLGLIIGAILFIKSVTKIPMNFREYKELVQKEFIARGFSSDYFYQLPERRWVEMFNTGLSPKDSVDEYLL